MSSTKALTDHDEIRKWAETHGARPASVAATANNDDPGILRLDFEEDKPDEGLREISWEEWLRHFDAKGLALLVSPDTRFNKLVTRHAA